MDGEAGIGLEALVRDAVRAEVGTLFDELRRFVDRRIAELSTEIHATVEMVDYSETNLAGKLQQMHEQLARVIALPAEKTRNSGIELEGIVNATEDAANRILSAAETIRASIEQSDIADKARVLEQVNAIFEACSFQDLTGQRVRRALQQLQTVEDELANIVSNGKEAPVERARPDKINAIAEITGSGPDLAQHEIDKLMAGLT
jgi:chemotaxis regulatin CheY-phosphate phosphatase CheZ